MPVSWSERKAVIKYFIQNPGCMSINNQFKALLRNQMDWQNKTGDEENSKFDSGQTQMK